MTADEQPVRPKPRIYRNGEPVGLYFAWVCKRCGYVKLVEGPPKPGYTCWYCGPGERED